MPDSPKDWRLTRPDFSDRDKYEQAGWYRTEAKDLSILQEKLIKGAVGTANREDKFATLHTYHNIEQDMFAATVNVFDQGVVLIAWSKHPEVILSRSQPVGAALLVDEQKDEWILKKSEDGLYVDVMGADPSSANQPMEVLLQFGNTTRSGRFRESAALTIKRAKD